MPSSQVKGPTLSAPFSLFQPFLKPLLLALTIIVIYLPGLQAPFIFDDFHNIVFNPNVHPIILTDISDTLAAPQPTHRPVAYLTFAINYWFSGLHPAAYRLTNIAIHILNATLLFYLLTQLTRLATSYTTPHKNASDHFDLAFWGALLWAAHPVQLYAVTYIVQRMSALATLFYLLALLLFVFYRIGKLSGRTAFPLITIAAIIGYACKEIVGSLPLALLAIELFFFRRNRPIGWRPVVTVLAIISSAILYLLLIGAFPNSWTVAYPERAFSPLQRLLTEFRILIDYLITLLWPASGRLQLDFDIALSHSLLQPITTLISLTALLAMLTTAFWLRQRQTLLGFALLFYLIGSVIESSFLNLELAFLHRNYLASLFLFAGVASVAARYLPPKPLSLLLVCVVLFFSLQTINTNQLWLDRSKLWALDLEQGANIYRASLNQMGSLIERGHYEEAVNIGSYALSSGIERKSTREEVDFRNITRQIAKAHYLQGQFDKALAGYQQFEAEFGPSESTRFYSAQIYLQQGQLEQAEIIANTELNTFNKALILSQLLQKRGETENAIQLLQQEQLKIHEKDPTSKQLLNMYLANLYLDAQRYEEALAIYQQAVRVDPVNYHAWVQIYRMQISAGNPEQAQKIRDFLLQKGLQIDAFH
jgi:tetratricopeptide (TPR) repeat protein